MVMSSRADKARPAGPRDIAGAGRPTRTQSRSGGVRGVRAHTYPYWFYAPAGIVYGLIFLVPTVIAFYFAFTRWTLFESEFIGLDNFRQFFSEQALVSGLKNTLIYAVVTSGLKVVLGMLLAVLLTGPIRSRGLMRSVIFFPVLVSTVAVGITFSVLLQPDIGLVSTVLAKVGITSPDWLGDPSTALLSVALVDVWKGVGTRHADLHRRDPRDPQGLLRGRRRRRRRGLDQVLERHRARWPRPPPSPSSCSRSSAGCGPSTSSGP